MTEWLGRRTWNPEVAGSSPALTTKLELFLGGPQFNSSVMFVNSQLVCLPPVGIFKPVMFIWNICFPQFEWYACELASVAKRMTTINKHLTFFWQIQRKNIGTQSVQELLFVTAFVELFTVMI